MAGPASAPGWRRYFYFAAVLLSALTAAITWLSFSLLRPTPPRTVAMAIGPEGGTSALLGSRYREILARDAIALRLVPTLGDVAGVALLRDPKSGVSICILPGGITNAKESPGLVSLGTLFYEPLWLFVRGDAEISRHENLRNLRISIGPEGSGSRALALEFFVRTGTIDQVSDRLLPLLPVESAEQLLRGEIDGIALLSAWDTAEVQKLVGAHNVKLLNMRRADAWVALYPYLNKLTLPAGVANMAENLPPNDVLLLAPKASLVVRSDLHPAIQYLLLEAATEIHSEPGLFRAAGQFPAAESIDLPLSEAAGQFYKTGRPFFQRHLPFWLAVLVQQFLVLLIPILGVLYPFLRFAPGAYAWAMRRRVYTLYEELRLLEQEIGSVGAAGFSPENLISRLDRLEERVTRFWVPVAYEPLVYDLRSHISLVRERLERSP